MQQSRFCVLTGHLNDYPLSDLVGILRHQQKTGRLLIEYAKGPAMFFFKNGELVDVKLENFAGLQAICVALGQPPASFNFNPLIQPTRRSIEPALQRTVSELLGCWDENAIEIERTQPKVEHLPENNYEAPPLLSSAPAEPRLEANNRLTAAPMPRLLAPAPAQSRYSLVALTITVGSLLIVALTTLIGTSGSTTALNTPPPEIPTSVVIDKPTEYAATASAMKVERRKESRGHREGTKPSQSVATSQNENQTAVTSETANQEAKVDAKPVPAAPSESRDEAKAASPGAGHSVQVILQVAEGRVTKASIGTPEPGMDAYEALALRIARQRRYSAKAAGQQVITIKVNQP